MIAARYEGPENCQLPHNTLEVVSSEGRDEMGIVRSSWDGRTSPIGSGARSSEQSRPVLALGSGVTIIGVDDWLPRLKKVA